MKSQFDSKARVVALENLKAMCERVSGFCHRFTVSKVTPNRVSVQYSNPDEYGSEHPITAQFPAYPSDFDGAENPAVVLHMINLVGARGDSEAWQSFTPLLDCPVLERNSQNHWAAADR